MGMRDCGSVHIGCLDFLLQFSPLFSALLQSEIRLELHLFYHPQFLLRTFFYILFGYAGQRNRQTKFNTASGFLFRIFPQKWFSVNVNLKLSKKVQSYEKPKFWFYPSILKFYW